jgi:hypothetical protein
VFAGDFATRKHPKNLFFLAMGEITAGFSYLVKTLQLADRLLMRFKRPMVTSMAGGLFKVLAPGWWNKKTRECGQR